MDEDPVGTLVKRVLEKPRFYSHLGLALAEITVPSFGYHTGRRIYTMLTTGYPGKRKRKKLYRLKCKVRT